MVDVLQLTTVSTSRHALGLGRAGGCRQKTKKKEDDDDDEKGEVSVVRVRNEDRSMIILTKGGPAGKEAR